MFANHISTKRLVSKIYEELIQLKNEKGKKQSDLKIGKGTSRPFSKVDTQMTNKYMKGCSASPIIREMQIKITMKYYLTPITMTIVK